MHLGVNMQKGPSRSPLLVSCLISSRSFAPSESWIEIDPVTIINEVGHGFHYLTHYQASVFDNRVFLPLASCDNILLHEFEDVKFFFTSAHEARKKDNGLAMQMLRSPFHQVIAVRGTIPNTPIQTQIYLGINQNIFLTYGKKRVVSSKVLCVRTEQANHDIHWYFSKEIDMLDYPLLCKRNLSRSLLKEIADKQKGIVLKDNMLSNAFCYWPLEELQREHNLKPKP